MINLINVNDLNLNEVSKFVRLDKYLNVYNILKFWLTKIDIFFKINSKMFKREANKILFIILYLKKITLN